MEFCRLPQAFKFFNCYQNLVENLIQQNRNYTVFANFSFLENEILRLKGVLTCRSVGHVHIITGTVTFNLPNHWMNFVGVATNEKKKMSVGIEVISYLFILL